jgi:TRAP-type C4-dicarboxylate transport system substrate-binding protein
VNKPGIILLTIILVTALLLTGCDVGTATKTTTAVAPINLIIALGTPLNHPVTETWQSWAKDVEAATHGRVKCKLYHSGSLIPVDKVYEGLNKGIVDCGNFMPSLNPGIFSVLEAFELPGNGPSSGTSASLAIWEAYKTTPQAQAEGPGIKILWLGASGSAHIGTLNKPIRILDDIKGLEIRGSGITTNSLDALGAVGVSLPMPDTYHALEKGMAEGAVCVVENLSTERFAEILKYYTVCYIYSAYRFYGGMSLKTWNSLPPDIQQIIAEVSDGYALKMGQNFDKYHELGYQSAVDNKIEFIRLSTEESVKWENRWAPIRVKWVEDMSAKGLPAQDILDKAVSLLAKYYLQYPDPVAMHLK